MAQLVKGGANPTARGRKPSVNTLPRKTRIIVLLPVLSIGNGQKENPPRPKGIREKP